jgi:hypothetical protein
MFEIILSPLAILLSLCTSTGILLHETKMDKVAALTVFSSSVTASQPVIEGSLPKLETTPHTHVERTSLNNASSELRNNTPNTAPRRDDKRYRLQKKVTRGVHVFDSYSMPLGLANNGQFGF